MLCTTLPLFVYVLAFISASTCADLADCLLRNSWIRCAFYGARDLHGHKSAVLTSQTATGGAAADSL